MKISNYMISAAVLLFLGIILGNTAGMHKDQGMVMAMGEKGIVKPEPAEPDSMRSLWSVTAYAPGKAPDMDETEARDMLFMPLDMDEKKIIFAGQKCEGVDFDRQTGSLEEYLGEKHGFGPGYIGLEEQKATIVRTNCGMEGFSEFLRLDDRRIVLEIRGMFFILEPVVDY
ncbi:hypothetical protein [Desulfonatronovibrio magnus]|uniref:hypothetical protein n=1 Tax=Desulfonatronovibrio magnus TaxID=698827 RepID=UPI0005EB440D|nr:hypothetical protein [Desulfonatronovibrio magnus]